MGPMDQLLGALAGVAAGSLPEEKEARVTAMTQKLIGLLKHEATTTNKETGEQFLDAGFMACVAASLAHTVLSTVEKWRKESEPRIIASTGPAGAAGGMGRPR